MDEEFERLLAEARCLPAEYRPGQSRTTGGLEPEAPAAPPPEPPAPPPAAAQAPTDQAPMPGVLAPFDETKPPRWRENPFAFKFPTPAELMLFVYPDHNMHNWQREEMYRFAGHCDPASPERFNFTKEKPFLYNLIAANGSGKDTYYITPCMAWFALCEIRSLGVVTTASHPQMENQTWKPIVDFCTAFNDKLESLGQKPCFEIKHYHIENTYNGALIVAFVTDEAGRVEGYHPQADHPDGKMLIVINEAKSIADPIFDSFSRFSGYSHWVQVSSPAARQGRFYKTCMMAQEDMCVPGKDFRRRVTAFDCPNIPAAHIERLRLIHGENSYIYQTSVLANFFDSELDVVITALLMDYPAPPWDDYDLEPAGGLDLALGGDKSTLSVVHGNKEVHRKIWDISDANILHKAIKLELDLAKNKFNLKAENVNGDGSGIGNPMIRRLHEDGYMVNSIRNDAPASNKDFYVNLGAEMWFKLKRLFEMRVIQPPDPANIFEHKQLVDELTTRKFVIRTSDQKIKLESKIEARASGAHSPDYADAFVLAWARYPLDKLLSRPPQARKEHLIDIANDPARYEELLQRMRARRERLQNGHDAYGNTPKRQYGLINGGRSR